MKRAGSAYMSGIAAAAGLHPRSTKLLRPPLRLYGAERVLAGEQTRIGPSARPLASPAAAPTAASAPTMPASPGTRLRIPGLRLTDTEAAAGPVRPANPITTTRPTLEREAARRGSAPVEQPVLEPAVAESQPLAGQQPLEPIAAAPGAQPIHAPVITLEPANGVTGRRATPPRAPAHEPAASAARSDLSVPDEQPPAAQPAREPVLTLEPVSTTQIRPQGAPSPAPARPSTRQQQAPAVQIGVIDVTVLPSPGPPISIAPQAPSQAPAAAGAPLSRGVGSWYGLAQR
jgi:hypothetical protein